MTSSFFWCMADETPFLTYWMPDVLKLFHVTKGQLGWVSYTAVDTERALTEARKSGKDDRNGFVEPLPRVSGNTSAHISLWQHGCFFQPVFCA